MNFCEWDPIITLTCNIAFFSFTSFRSQLKCHRGNKRFDVHLRLIRSVFFLSKDGRAAFNEGRGGWKRWSYPASNGTSVLIFVNATTFPHLYFDLACLFPLRKMYKQEKWKYKKTTLEGHRRNNQAQIATSPKNPRKIYQSSVRGNWE